MERTLHILLVDDHPLYREALLPVLRQLADGVHVEQAASIAQTVDAIDRLAPFDLVLLDLALPDGGGMRSLMPVCQLLPDTPVVVISASEDRQLVMDTLAAGARGYIPKSAHSAVIANALSLVLSGETYIPSLALDGLGSPTRPPAEAALLTGRQEEVLRLLAQGYSNKEIGRALHIADTTVRVHVSDILQQLQAHNRTGAVIRAQQLGLLDPPAR